jgi:hypothetical protein
MFNLAKLPEVKSLSTALRTIQADVGPTGTVIIKMDKTGHWVFGADQEEVEADSTWAVNPFSFVHGYIAWGDGDVLGEKMVSVSEPLPEMDDAPPMAKRGWEVQVGMSLKCLTGEDKGMEARYTTTSAGGKRGVQTLAVAIAEMVDKDPSKPVPVVLLKKEHYQHKSYGRIYTPLFDIQSWVSMDGEEPVAEEPVAEEAAPTRRRRSAT